VLVLRFTIGQTTQEVRTPRGSVVVGSDPTADVTLQDAGLAARAFRLVREDTEVHLEILDASGVAAGEGGLTLRVGDVVHVNGVEVALVGLLPTGSAAWPTFGGYEDAPPSQRTFELSDAHPAPVSALASATGAAAVAAATPPPATPPPATPPPAGATTRASPAMRQRPPTRRPSPEEKAAALRPLKFPDPHFGTELVRQLKRTPFFAVSVAIHLLIFFAIFLFDTTAAKPLRQGPGAVSASVSSTDDELGKQVPLEDDGVPLDEMKLPDLPELELDETPPETKPRPEPPSPFQTEIEDAEPEPMDVGIMPGLRVVTARPRKRKPRMPAVNLNQKFTKGAAGTAMQRSADTIRAQLGRGRYGNAATLDDLTADDILVVSGSFDKIGRVLDALRLKYVRKAPWALSSPQPVSFSSFKIIFWNCGESLGRRRMAAIGKRLRTFVRKGGYLFTTDWGVANVLDYAFPGFVKTNGSKAQLPEMVLPIEPARSARNHPLLEGVFHDHVQGKWWLEQASFDISVGRPDRVTVLIESPMLRDTFNRSPAVAVTFHDGRGRVLHAMGHYYQEAGNLAGTISAHRLALNFVLMRLEQDRKAGLLPKKTR